MPLPLPYLPLMHVKIVVHEAEEGGFWGEVPALPGCASQGETLDELLANLREAIAGWLEADIDPPHKGGSERIVELAL
jgi:predicted RNase H-like HicB family nuclease